MRLAQRILLILLLCVLLAVSASAAEVEAIYISCGVETDGRAAYSMAVSCRFDTQEKSITIPLAGERISDVSVSGASWDQESSDGWNRVVLRSRDGFIGRQTFVITWRTPATELEDGFLQLPLVGSRWDMDAAEVTFSVELPAAIEEEPVLISGYSGELQSDVERTGTGFTCHLTEGLMAHEALTVQMRVPEDYFTRSQLRHLLSLDWSLVALLLLVVLSLIYWARLLRNRRIVIASRVLPPEGWTPAELAVILRDDRPDMASQLLLWGRLGYLNVDFAGGELVLSCSMRMGSERSAHEIELFDAIFDGRREFWLPDRRLRQAMGISAQRIWRIWRTRLFDRRGGNPKLLELLAALTSGIALSSSLTLSLPEGAGWTLLSLLAFFPGIGLALMGQRAVGELRRKPWLHAEPIPGLLALLLLIWLGKNRVLYLVPSLALQIFVGWQLAFGGRRSVAGVEALGQLLGLQRFLLHASQRRLREMLQRDPAWLQTVLPYAAQLGLAHRLARRMGAIRIEEPSWLQTDEPLTNPTALAGQTLALLAQLRGGSQSHRDLGGWLRKLLR